MRVGEDRPAEDQTVATILHLMGAIEMFAIGRALDGLSDDEYFWEPAQPCWSVRERGHAASAAPLGDGDWVIDYDPDIAALPAPSPVRTSIGWQLAHVAPIPGSLADLDFLGGRRDPAFEPSVVVPASAAAGAELLREGWHALITALRRARDIDLACEWEWAFGRAVGYGHVTLMLNEVSHHLAYIGALRDEYAARGRLHD